MSTDTERYTAFGDWLRTTLTDVGRRPDQLARHLGLDPARVGRWLSGRERPTPEQCERLATALGIPTRTVLSWAGHRPGPPRPVSPAAPTPSPLTADPPAPRTRTRSVAMPVPNDSLAAAATVAPPPASQADAPLPPEDAAAPAPAPTPRPRRPARATSAPHPPPIPPAPASERIAALRSLADELDAVLAAYGHLQAERERLDQECTRLAEENGRLAAENAQLRTQVVRVRAALALDPPARR